MNGSRRNPILTREDIPDVDVSSIFNPGAIRFRDKYFLLLRVQTRGRETLLMVAESDDGENFDVRPEIVKIDGMESVNEKIYHVYDPRLTQIGDTIFIVFASDVDNACRLGIAKTDDFKNFELVGFDSERDTRNGVLFPEKFDGKYYRLERPNRVKLENGPMTGTEIVLSESDNLIHWTEVSSVMKGRQRYWDEIIGSGPPPVKTKKGWLHIYHGVATHFESSNIYQAGVVLLDLEEPWQVISRSRNNVLEPREMYEIAGQVPNVVFPSGMIVDEIDGDGFTSMDSVVRIYYGAADTVVGMVKSTIVELIEIM